MPDIRSPKAIFILCGILWLIIVARTVMNAKGPEDFVRTVPQSEIQSFAKTQLSEVQSRSISEDQELCSVIFEDSEGSLGITGLVAGEKASCDIAYFDEPGMAPVASFHTHGAHDLSYDSEVPSLLDMRSDVDSQVDGYISTPGGRFWRINAASGVAEQVCGEGCLVKDPNYQPCDTETPKDSYSFSELQARFESQGTGC